jgi:hypothetical protein
MFCNGLYTFFAKPQERKSQLAIEYAYRVRDTQPQTWVFWAHASSVTRFEEGYRKIAAHLRLTGWNEPKADNFSMVHGWLSDETNGRWTMVLDNADDADFVFEPLNGGISTNTTAASTDRSMSEFLPLSPSGSIIITSCSREVVEGLIKYRDDVLEVKPMDVEVAAVLLMKKLKKPLQDAILEESVRLVQQLDCMPLAITQTAAYINQRAPRMTVSRYSEILEHDDDERTKLLQKDIRDPRRDSRASNSIITTWHVSFRHVREKCDSVWRLPALMSLFNREAIPDHLLRGRYVEAKDSQTDFEDDIVTLRAYSLIGVDVSGKLFDMHGLVQLSTRRWLEMHAQLQGWQERYINILGAAFPTGNYATWITC